MKQARKQRGLTVAITGASSGLGRELALGFSAKGYRVFGTAFSANDIAEFQNLSAGGGDITFTITDITKEEQVHNWKEQVRKLLNGSGLPASEAAARVIEISEQVPAPIRAPVGKDAEEILRAVREKSDEELDIVKAKMFGFSEIK